MINADKIRQKAQADKVSLSLVFKEHVQLVVLEYLFRKGLFAQMVFQGGTALRLAYQGVRYSEDLDFVLKKKNLPCFKNMQAELLTLAAHAKKAIPFIMEARLKTQKETDSFRRYSLILRADFLNAADKTNIEIANVPSRDHHTVILRHPEIALPPAVTVESPEEILGDKLLAFCARDYIKGRDLWDIHFLMNTLNVPLNAAVISLFKMKAKDYGLDRKRLSNSLKEKTAQLKKDGAGPLRDEMDKFLPAAYREAFQAQYAGICAAEYRLFNALQEKLNA